MKRVLIAGLAVALNAGCVATYVRVQPDPVRVTVARFAVVYRSEFRVTEHGVESYNGRPDAETVKAVAGAPWWMRVIGWFKGG
jgi:hypothetical protein